MSLTDDLTDQHIAIVGKVGSGKTYTAKGLAEDLLRLDRRVIVMDPTGAWWGLPWNTNGEVSHQRKHVLVLGGLHGEIDIDESKGEILANWLVEHNASAVVDLSEMLIGDRHRFSTDFLEALYRANRTPLHLFIDEADEFARQNPLPETRRLFHHVDRIIRRGRIRGFKAVMITQRPAVLHKDVLTQANAMIAMRLTSPQDRAAVEAWVSGHSDTKKGKGAELLGSLASLPVGEGWIWAPELDVLKRQKFPRIESFDSSKTPTEDDVPLLKSAKEMLAGGHREVLESLRKLVAPGVKVPVYDAAVVYKHDPVSEDALTEARARGFEEGYAAANEAIRGQADFIRENMGVLHQTLGEATKAISDATRQATLFEEVAQNMTKGPPMPASHLPTRDETPRIRELSPRIREAAAYLDRGYGALSSKQRMLWVLAHSRDPISLSLWGTLAGLKTGGTLSTYAGQMTSGGFAVYASGVGYQASPKGIDQAVPLSDRIALSTLVALWEKIGPRPLEMMKLVIHRKTITLKELGETVGLANGGTLSTYAGRITSTGLIVFVGKKYQLNPEVFDWLRTQRP